VRVRGQADRQALMGGLFLFHYFDTCCILSPGGKEDVGTLGDGGTLHASTSEAEVLGWKSLEGRER
jgi:hypothetical protein